LPPSPSDSIRSPRRPGWRQLLAASNSVHHSAKGELLVAQIRLLLTVVLLGLAVSSALKGEPTGGADSGLGVAGAALAISIVIYLAVRSERAPNWTMYVTSVLDVTIVSGALVTFLLFDQPHRAVNSKIAFDVYFLAIFATALRYNVRACVLAGALAVVQYAGVVVYASGHWALNDAAYAPFVSGMFSWQVQLSRIVLLAIATVLSATVIFRGTRLQQLSSTDRMTGLFNRGYFDERLAAELSRARRNQHPLSLVMMDVDHFKRFNDRHGHAAGDAALKAVATLVRQMVRRSDVVARYGGEEFVLVMPETSAESAVEKLEAIRIALADTAIRLPKDGGVGKVTMSAGIATYPADGVSADELLDEADARLFRAKESGRNRVIGRASGDLAAPHYPPEELRGSLER
jgi:two-component system, cell cycle response regulator